VQPKKLPPSHRSTTRTTHCLTMGYASLEPHLPSSHAPLLPPGTFLSITDTQASDGNFLLHHIISNYIKADHNVVLVGLAGILIHYTTIGRKLVTFRWICVIPCGRSPHQLLFIHLTGYCPPIHPKSRA